MPDAETVKMLRDYMENGFLENIADMFRHDTDLWGAVPEMIADERSRVRIGTVALVETMREEQPEEALAALPGIAAALGNPEPTIRGDVVFLLCALRLKEAVPYLREAFSRESSPAVKDEIGECIAELGG